MAITEAVKEAIWLQGLLRDLGIGQKSITLFYDSQSAIQLAKNQVYHTRTKHVDVRYHFVRDIIEEGGVMVQKIRTTDNPADILTKVVTAIKFQHSICQSLKGGIKEPTKFSFNSVNLRPTTTDLLQKKKVDRAKGKRWKTEEGPMKSRKMLLNIVQVHNQKRQENRMFAKDAPIRKFVLLLLKALTQVFSCSVGKKKSYPNSNTCGDLLRDREGRRRRRVKK
nr:uncharacterized protein LOC108948180 [Nicotiana tomentosiformis]